MFVSAIEAVEKFTRPIHTVVRQFKSDRLTPSASTLFFVNDHGDAVTCGHIIDNFFQSTQRNTDTKKYKQEKAEIINAGQRLKTNIEALNKKYNLLSDMPYEIINRFINCYTGATLEYEIKRHPVYDLGLIRFKNYEKKHFDGHALLLKDSSLIKQGTQLCRLGYPFAEFTNYTINNDSDELQWVQEGKVVTPCFPIDGIVTRLVSDSENLMGIEMSTPGLIGQSGGPLFDKQGVIYGMQFETIHLPLGFYSEGEISSPTGKFKHYSDNPFLHVGRCIHIDIIKQFLDSHGVEYSVST